MGELIEMLPLLVVKLRTVVMLPGLKGLVVEGSIVRVILPVPALRFAPAPKAMSPAVALARFAPMAVESLAVREIFPLLVPMPALTVISRPACIVIPTPGLVIAIALLTVMSLFACKKTLAPAALIVVGAIVRFVLGVSEN